LFIALDYTSIARSSIMFYSMPVWLAIAAHFVLPDERLTALRSLGLLLAMVGMIWSLGSGLFIEGGSITGDLLALLSAFGWGAIALTVRLSSLSRERAETQLFIQLLISAPVLLIASLWFGDWLREPTYISYAALLFQALVIAFFAFLLWFWIMTIYPASGVASFSFLSPIFSVALGWLILGEEVSLNLVGALACVALGLVLINRK
jgi:drug/metabolite transporter (DMT)-like permease